MCAAPFVPQRMGQAVCSIRCAKRVPILKRKKEAAAFKARKLQAKRRADWLADVEHAFNAYIRARDAHLGCISCGTMTGQMHAGHFQTVGAFPELRFDEANVHKQCARCNKHMHGNLLAYRAALVLKVGQATVERLEGPTEPKKYLVADLIGMVKEYRLKLRELSK